MAPCHCRHRRPSYPAQPNVEATKSNHRMQSRAWPFNKCTVSVCIGPLLCAAKQGHTGVAMAALQLQGGSALCKLICRHSSSGSALVSRALQRRQTGFLSRPHSRGYRCAAWTHVNHTFMHCESDEPVCESCTAMPAQRLRQSHGHRRTSTIVAGLQAGIVGLPNVGKVRKSRTALWGGRAAAP